MDKCGSSFALNREPNSSRDLNSLWNTSHGMMSAESPDRQVQRSISLRLDTKPTLRGCGGKDRDVRDINGNFELAHLLARASSLDAKLMMELQDEDQYSSEHHPLPDWPSLMSVRQKYSNKNSENESVKQQGVEEENQCNNTFEVQDSTTDFERINLPLRYRQMIQRRKASRVQPGPAVSPPATGGSGSLNGVHTLGCLPEAEDDAAVETVEEGKAVRQRSVSLSDSCSLAVRQRDAKLAMLWAHQEVRSLKQQNRQLLRQLLELGAAIHRLGGMDSSHSVSGNLGQQGDYGQDDDVMPAANDSAAGLRDSLSGSMVTISTQSTNQTTRKLPHLSFKSIDHFFGRD